MTGALEERLLETSNKGIIDSHSHRCFTVRNLEQIAWLTTYS